jgi:hypothetical protein
MTRLSTRIVGWGVYLYLASGLARLWFKIYQWLWERNKLVKIQRFKDLEALILLVKTLKWRADSWRELGDAISSPEAIQWQIENSPKKFIGDCLPENTRVELWGVGFVELNKLTAGDIILGHNNWTRVIAVVNKGKCLVDKLKLSNGSELVCTPCHILIDRNLCPKQARTFSVGDSLLTNNDYLNKNKGYETTIIEYQKAYAEVNCYDISVEGSLFWLPDQKIIVHNCDEFAVYQAAVINNELIDNRDWTLPQVKHAQVLSVMWRKTGGQEWKGNSKGFGGHNVCLNSYSDGTYSYQDYQHPSERRGTIQEVVNDVRLKYAQVFEPLGWVVQDPVTLKVVKISRN